MMNQIRVTYTSNDFPSEYGDFRGGRVIERVVERNVKSMIAQSEVGSGIPTAGDVVRRGVSVDGGHLVGDRGS